MAPPMTTGRRRAVLATHVLPLALTAWGGSAIATPPRGNDLAEAVEAVRQARDDGELARAEELARDVVDRAESQGDPRPLGNALRTLATVLIDLNRYDEAERVLDRALQVLEPLGVTAELGKALNQMARVHRFGARYPTALDWLLRAEHVFRRLDDREGLQSVYNLYGVIYDFLGELERSLEWHQKALSLARELEDSVGLASSLYALGEVHRALGEHEEALEYFQDALARDEATGVVPNIAYSHIKVGLTQLALSDLASARTHLTRARDLFASMGTPRDHQWSLASLALLERAEGDLYKGRAMLRSVLEHSLREGWPVLLNRARVWLAELEFEAQRHDQALALLETALADVLAQQSLRRALRIYELQAEILESAGRPAEALTALRAREELEQQLFDALRTSVLAAKQGEAEFERQALALELAEKEQALTRLALERETTLRLASIATLLVLFVVAFLVYGRVLAQRQNRRLSEEVARTTAQLRERHEELQQAYTAVEQASVTDELTGLANRRFLERHIGADAARALRLYADWDGPGTPSPSAADLVFFLVDLDRFKAVNDREGHAAGDAVLIQVSRLLEREFRKGDFVVRWGGEEFLVVGRFIDRGEGPAIAERVRSAVAAHVFEIEAGPALRCTCSIGVAAFPLIPERPDALDWQDVLKLADHALYLVKQGPRDGWAELYASRPTRPTRPVADWIPGALRNGALEARRSFDDGA